MTVILSCQTEKPLLVLGTRNTSLVDRHDCNVFPRGQRIVEAQARDDFSFNILYLLIFQYRKEESCVSEGPSVCLIG